MNTSPILFVDLRIAREYFARIAEGLQHLRLRSGVEAFEQVVIIL